MGKPFPDQHNLYSRLAWLWPYTSPVEDYEAEANEFVDLIRQYSQIPVTTLLDLGCGGGHNNYWLKHHYQITGVDISTAMLTHARQLNPQVSYIHGDMRSLQLEQQFDAVICGDSIEYMLHEDDLQAAIRTAYQHLKPGGVFCTYAEEIRETFQQNRTNSITHKKNETTVTAIENFYDPNPADTTYETTFLYLIRKEGQLSIEQDHHLCGLFGLDTWIGLMEETGFKVSLLEYEEAGPMFVCLKPGQA